MIHTQVQLTEEQAHTLKILAREENVSIADLIRQAVDHWLQQVMLISIEERNRRAIAAAGRFHSGINELAERHDDYLIEAYGEL